MIRKINIKNFRSIKDQTLDIAKITILYGHNGSGKSSFMYAPLVFKNLLVNPNQTIDELFNFHSINLGNYLQVVHNHDNSNNIQINFTFDDNISYSLELVRLKSEAYLKLEIPDKQISEKAQLKLTSASYPSYQAPIRTPKPVQTELKWDGFSLQLSSNPQLEAKVNSELSLIQSIDVVPILRGFFKSVYSGQIKLSKFLATDDEVAVSLLENNGYIAGEVNYYLEKIFNRNFHIFVPLNSSFLYLRVIDRENRGLEMDLINDGFGVNQVVFMLAKILNKNNKLIFIEEPEIHLHPKAQEKLVEAFIDIVKNTDKTLVVSTHSEILVNSLLTKVVEGKIEHKDILFYVVDKHNKATILKKQKVTPDGKVEGGLMTFMETELENLKKLLGV